MNGVDRTRDSFMREQFKKSNIDENKVIWIKNPNKDELSNEFIKKIFKFERQKLKKGQISITYKHYLAYKHMVENNIELAVIMEDNIEFKTDDFPGLLKEYLKEIPEDWDIIYEGDTMKYLEGPITEDKKIYKKSHNGGATNAANCYILPLKTAKKFHDNYMPFTNVTDHYMNELLKRFNMNVYWSVPPMVHRIRRKSTLQYD